jgi:hypothetical protein
MQSSDRQPAKTQQGDDAVPKEVKETGIFPPSDDPRYEEEWEPVDLDDPEAEEEG